MRFRARQNPAVPRQRLNGDERLALHVQRIVVFSNFIATA